MPPLRAKKPSAPSSKKESKPRTPPATKSADAPAAPQERASDAYTRFIASMEMNFDKWHDGEGYDLAALDQLTPQERESVRHLLKGRSDWRDVEALARLDPPANEDLFRTFVNESMPLVTRLAAGESLRELGEAVDCVPLIVKMLDAAEGDVSVMSRVFDHIEWNLPADPRVKRHLLTRLLTMTTPAATNFAATVWVVYGLCETRYDWTDRPEWLKFQDAAEHDAAMDRLLARIGVTRDELARPMRG